MEQKLAKKNSNNWWKPKWNQPSGTNNSTVTRQTKLKDWKSKTNHFIIHVKENLSALFEKKSIVPKLDSEIPPSQAAHIQRRSTNEKKCFVTKVLTEKVTTSQCYTINFVMLDMSKKNRHSR